MLCLFKFDAKQKLTVICLWSPSSTVCQSFICITSVIFWALLLMSLSLPVFGYVWKFVLIKLQLPIFFEGAAYLPTLQTCCQNTTCCIPAVQTCQTPLQKCPGLLLNAYQMPKEMLEASDFFFSTVKVCCFWPCVFWKLAKFGHSWCWEHVCLWFFRFLFQWSNDNKFAPPQKQGTYQLVAKSHSY